MSRQDEIHYIVGIMDQIYDLNKVLIEYFNYLVLEIEEGPGEEEPNLEFPKVPF